jgi:hypothetical protein
MTEYGEDWQRRKPARGREAYEKKGQKRVGIDIEFRIYKIKYIIHGRAPFKTKTFARQTTGLSQTPSTIFQEVTT